VAPSVSRWCLKLMCRTAGGVMGHLGPIYATHDSRAAERGGSRMLVSGEHRPFWRRLLMKRKGVSGEGKMTGFTGFTG
jgi:hypothetical protein